MNEIIRRATLMAALTLALNACSGGDDGGDSSPIVDNDTPTDTQPDTPAPVSTTAEFDIDSSALIGVYPEQAYTGTNGGIRVYQGLSNDTSTTPATSAYLNFSINAETAGDYQLRIYYAFGGTETNLRDAWLYVNGVKTTVDDDDIIEFAYTGVNDGKNNDYAYTDYIPVSLVAGDNDIRLAAVNTENYSRTITFTRSGSGGNKDETGTGYMKGLPNVNSIELSGTTTFTAGSGSTVLLTLNASADSANGVISVSPEQDFYTSGTSVTLTATANAGYKFDAWTGDAPSVEQTYQFEIDKNLQLKARFIRDDATQASGLVGFGSVQDDKGTAYTLTGGHGAAVTEVSTLTELQAALSNDGPLQIKVSGVIDNSGKPSVSLNVPSNTTIFGDPAEQGHLKNIELKLSGENYILRNLIMSDVVAVEIQDGSGNTLVADGQGNDVLALNGAQHVWIDHCEFYTSLTPDALYDFSGPNDGPADGQIDEYDSKDFHDGLIDIKNGASFITLSHNYMHDHWKAILIGSGDDDLLTSNTRITLHHNYFKDIVSRIPLLRFGKGHFFNNFIESTNPIVYGDLLKTDSIVNLRNGAEGLIEGNYVHSAEDTFGHYHGGDTGYWTLNDNTYVDIDKSEPTSNAVTDYAVPYPYVLEASSAINTSVPTGAGVGILTASDLPE